MIGSKASILVFAPIKTCILGNFRFILETVNLSNFRDNASCKYWTHARYSLQGLWHTFMIRLIDLSSSLICFSNARINRSEEHTSELQSRFDLVCRLLLEK